MNEEIKEHIKKIESEVFQIFNFLESTRGISPYRGTLLKQKLDILLLGVYNDLQKIEENEAKKESKYRQFFKATILLESLKANGIKTVSLSNILDKKLEDEDTITYDFRRLMRRVDDLHCAFKMCYRLLDFRVNSNMSLEDDLESNRVDKVTFANQILEISLSAGKISEDTPEDIKNIIVMMLQDTLQTEEANLNILFQMAKEEYDRKMDEEGQKLTGND